MIAAAHLLGQRLEAGAGAVVVLVLQRLLGVRVEVPGARADCSARSRSMKRAGTPARRPRAARRARGE
ncbi:hypothetical protein [Georgenia sp. SUBG003]|uniref:hypothetical protein n=1 Tax=Georgenia sp. SUBG003 TaxID=1497974 RepID=UPI003AB62BA6